ncbi:uncharacterized protein LOC124132672 [Haliotis rufescens]|uniref:uncharacterized protein LOC124132672 n=1 Tax=Haliotis rufescens TaxID=6454 RepID=UPI00201F1569|nr:uncharacterized protein LOC124132672 [Haliotis rufescens]
MPRLRKWKKVIHCVQTFKKYRELKRLRTAGAEAQKELQDLLGCKPDGLDGGSEKDRPNENPASMEEEKPSKESTRSLLEGTEKVKPRRCRPHMDDPHMAVAGRTRGRCRPHKDDSRMAVAGRTRGRCKPHKDDSRMAVAGRTRGRCRPHKDDSRMAVAGRTRGHNTRSGRTGSRSSSRVHTTHNLETQKTEAECGKKSPEKQFLQTSGSGRKRSGSCHLTPDVLPECKRRSETRDQPFQSGVLMVHMYPDEAESCLARGPGKKKSPYRINDQAKHTLYNIVVNEHISEYTGEEQQSEEEQHEEASCTIITGPDTESGPEVARRVLEAGRETDLMSTKIKAVKLPGEVGPRSSRLQRTRDLTTETIPVSSARSITYIKVTPPAGVQVAKQTRGSNGTRRIPVSSRVHHQSESSERRNTYEIIGGEVYGNEDPTPNRDTTKKKKRFASTTHKGRPSKESTLIPIRRYEQTKEKLYTYEPLYLKSSQGKPSHSEVAQRMFEQIDPSLNGFCRGSIPSSSRHRTFTPAAEVEQSEDIPRWDGRERGLTLSSLISSTQKRTATQKEVQHIQIMVQEEGEEQFVVQEEGEEQFVVQEEGEEQFVVQEEGEEQFVVQEEGEEQFVVQEEGEEQFVVQEEGEEQFVVQEEGEEQFVVQEEGEEQFVVMPQVEQFVVQEEGEEQFVVQEEGEEQFVVMPQVEQFVVQEEGEEQFVVQEEGEEQFVVQEEGEEQFVVQEEGEEQFVVQEEGEEQFVVQEEGEEQFVVQEEGEEQFVVMPQVEEQFVVKSEVEEWILVQEPLGYPTTPLVQEYCRCDEKFNSLTLVQEEGEEQFVVKREVEEQFVVMTQVEERIVAQEEDEERFVVMPQVIEQAVAQEEGKEQFVVKQEEGKERFVVKQEEDEEQFVVMPQVEEWIVKQEEGKEQFVEKKEVHKHIVAQEEGKEQFVVKQEEGKEQFVAKPEVEHCLVQEEGEEQNVVKSEGEGRIND